LLLDLKRLVVCELNDMWDWLEERLVYMDLGVRVDGVIAYVQKLRDLRLGELLDDALS
jgi:hypothetical protein